MEVLLCKVYQLLMANSTSADNDNIFTEVIGLMEVDDHISIDLIDVINISQNWLTHHVLSVNVVVYIFHKSLHVIIVSGFKLLPNGVLLHF